MKMERKNNGKEIKRADIKLQIWLIPDAQHNISQSFTYFGCTSKLNKINKNYITFNQLFFLIQKMKSFQKIDHQDKGIDNIISKNQRKKVLFNSNYLNVDIFPNW